MFAQYGGAFDQSSSRFAEHHRARRGDRFHPLRHPDLLPNGGVTQGARTDLPRNHFTGIQPHPQLQIDAVNAPNLVSQT